MTTPSICRRTSRKRCASFTKARGSALSRVRFVGCVSHDESNSRTAFPTPCNRYQAGFLERTKRPAFCIGFDAPVLHHQVGNNEGIALPQPPNVPEHQSNQQCLYAQAAGLTYPSDIDRSSNEFASDRIWPSAATGANLQPCDRILL